MFGGPRLREVLTGQHEAPLGELQRTIVESVENFLAARHQADDITLLLVRYRAASAS